MYVTLRHYYCIYKMCQETLAIISPYSKTKPSKPPPDKHLENFSQGAILPERSTWSKALFMSHYIRIMLMGNMAVLQLDAIKVKILGHAEP